MGNVEKIAQIVDGVVNWVFNADGVDSFPALPGEFPNWPPPGGCRMTLVDVTGKTGVAEGMYHIPETGEFTFEKPEEGGAV